MTQPDPVEQRVAIARFNCLPETSVVEHWTFSHEEWLSWLEKKPAQSWRGTHTHPGWSPVLYDPPERAKENIKQVFGLVLDYDKKATWDQVAALWKHCYGLIYTTKSHDIDKHRVRVVLPLTRPITPDEYDKLWRWADRQSRKVDLEVDGQAKDASRFWYMPTLPDRGEWRAERLPGRLLDVDATLPLCEAPSLRVVRQMPAIVTTDAKVTRARRYLEKIPPAVSGDGGHTQTFNAVAHVMIGFDLDPDTTYSIIASDYNPRCDPPWSERELQHKIQSVAKTCQRQRGYLLDVPREPIVTIQAAADRAPALPEEHDVDWRVDCCYKKPGVFRRAYQNVLRFVCHHESYRGKWSLNTMTGDVWFDGAPMMETLIHDIRAHADQVMGFTPAPSDVQAAIQTAAEQRSFHPVQQYLRSIDWDGTSRLSGMARDYLGSEEPLHAEMVRRWMIGAVARALSPGCKLDTALMLYGRQGLYKSTFFAILGGPYHADSTIDIQNKDSYQQIHAAWIYEFAELENVVTGRAESRLKAWLTSTHDMFRAPYARSVTRKARAVALCGSTNRQQILTDDTGSRRFWIVPVANEVPRALLTEMRDQLWAEAVCAYESGAAWWFDADLERQRSEANRDFNTDDPWAEAVAGWVGDHVYETTAAEIMREALKMDAARMDHYAQVRIGRVMADLGWEKVKSGGRTDRRWVYRRCPVRPDGVQLK